MNAEDSSFDTSNDINWDDESSVYETILHCPGFLELASERLRDNERIVTKAVELCSHAFKSASKRLQDNETIARLALKQNPYLIGYASLRLRNNLDFMEYALNLCPHTFRSASLKIRDNESFAHKAVSRHYSNYGSVSERLQDSEVLFVRTIHCIKRIERKNQKLFSDGYSEFKNYFIGEILNPLAFASDRLKNNKNFVLYAIKQSGNMLEFASDHLKDDFDVVYQSVSQNPYSLEYASERLQDNETIIYKAIKEANSLKPLEFASCRFREDIHLLKNINSDKVKSFNYLSDGVKKNPEILLNYMSFHELISTTEIAELTLIKNQLITNSDISFCQKVEKEFFASFDKFFDETNQDNSYFYGKLSGFLEYFVKYWEKENIVKLYDKVISLKHNPINSLNVNKQLIYELVQQDILNYCLIGIQCANNRIIKKVPLKETQIKKKSRKLLLFVPAIP
jgi:hypothetical protein